MQNPSSSSTAKSGQPDQPTTAKGPSPSTVYTVLTAKPHEVKADLCRLWADNLKLATSAEDKFKWLYDEAPEVPDSVFMLKANDPAAGGGVENNDVVVGTNAIGIRRYQLDSGKDTTRAGVCSDLAVDLVHRSLMPALKLMRAVSAYSADSFDVTYGFPNDKAKMVVLRGGFKLLGESKRHVRVLRHAAYASRVKEQPNVPKAVVWAAEKGAESLPLRIAAGAFDAFKLASHPLELLRANTAYELLYTSRFDERFDRLWESARGEYNIVGERTSAFLNWRCPRNEVATLVKRGKKDTILGYAILEENPKDRWHILDIFGHHAELEPLLDLLLGSLWRRGAVNVSIGFLGAPRVAALLASRGFVSREEPRTIVVLPGKSRAADAAALVDKDRWHLFAIDEDT